MAFDAKIMTLHLDEPKSGLHFGLKKPTYSYVKIKRQLENKIKVESDFDFNPGTTKIQRQVKIGEIPISLEVDTTPQFYSNLKVRDTSFRA